MLVADNSFKLRVKYFTSDGRIINEGITVNANVKKSNWRLRISSGDNYYLDSYNRLYLV